MEPASYTIKFGVWELVCYSDGPFSLFDFWKKKMLAKLLDNVVQYLP